MAELKLKLLNGDCANPSLNVVFVHGIGGGPVDTWCWKGGEDDGYFWPRWLAEDMQGLGVYSLGYPADKMGWNKGWPIEQGAVAVLDTLLSDKDLRSSAETPIVFVCHSLGGIIVKKLILKANNVREAHTPTGVFLDRIAGVVFLATPHDGSTLATIASKFGWLVSDTMKDLVANSAKLGDISNDYRNYVAANNWRIGHKVYYENDSVDVEKPVNSFTAKLLGAKAEKIVGLIAGKIVGLIAGKVVTSGSANPGLVGPDPVPVGRDHINICKVSDRKDKVYTGVRTFLEEALGPRPESMRKIVEGIKGIKDDTGVIRRHLKDDGKRGEPSFQLQPVKTEFENAASMLGHPVIYEFLEEECNQKSVFPGVKLKMLRQPIGSSVIPMAVAVFAAGVPVRLGKLNTKVWAFDDVEADDYIKKRDMLIGNTLIGKTDKVTYTARQILNTGDYCEIEGGVTKYLSGLKMHHALQHELLSSAHALKAEGKLTARALESRLTKRRKFFASLEADQLRYRPISISALIIHKSKDEGYKIMIRKRSAKVAVEPNMLQAIPSFTFQPEVDAEKEWNVQHCVLKEYAEELFDEKVDETRADTHEFIFKFGPVRDLSEALRTGQCELLYSGVVLDLMLLFPEIFCVLLVHDPEWFGDQQDRFSPNWEVKSLHDMLHTSDSVLLEYHLDDAEEEFLDSGRKTAENIWRTWSRFGMSSFWLGVDTARKHLATNR